MERGPGHQIFCREDRDESQDYHGNQNNPQSTERVPSTDPQKDTEEEPGNDPCYEHDEH